VPSDDVLSSEVKPVAGVGFLQDPSYLSSANPLDGIKSLAPRSLLTTGLAWVSMTHPQTGRMITVYDFIYSQFGVEFRMTEGDLLLWKWLESTNRIEKYLKWRTAVMLARGVANDDLPSPPKDMHKFPGIFKIPSYGLTMADEMFWRKRFCSRRQRGYKLGFLFSLFQGKAGSLEVPSYMVRQEVLSTLERLEKNKDVTTDISISGTSVTEDDVISQLRRTVREVFAGSEGYFKKRLPRAFPSQNACFERKKGDGGAAGHILDTYSENKFFPYDYLMGYSEGPLGIKEIRSPWSGEDCDEFLSFSKSLAMTQDSSCVPIGLPEPFKVRTITKGSAFPYYLSSLYRKAIWRKMKLHPVFQLTGKPVDFEMMDEFANLCKFGPNDHLISTDFQAATDHIPSLYSEVVCEELCQLFAIPFEHRLSILRSLTRHHIYDGEVLHGEQDSGQLMGGFWSFVVLCIIHATGVRHCLELCRSEKLRLRDMAFRLNGDDGLFEATKSEFSSWNQYMSWFGLIPSLGKTLVHQRYCTINSEMWRFKPVRVQTKLFDITVGFEPSRIPHIYMGWGYGRCPRDVTDRKRGCMDLHPSNLLSGFLESCPRPDLGWKFLFKQHGRTMLQNAKRYNLALCLSPYLGGLGFPLPPSGALRKRRAPAIRSRLFARVYLDHPEDSRISRMTDYLIGKTREDSFSSRLASLHSRCILECGGVKRRELILLGRQAIPMWNEEKEDIFPSLFFSPWYGPTSEDFSNVLFTGFVDSYIRRYRPEALSLSQLSRGTVHSNDYFARFVLTYPGFD
jgi:hypothetical protein